jgi:hypothetical protein
MRLGGAFSVVYCFGALTLLVGGLAGAFPYVLDAHDVTREQWLVAAAPLYAVTIVLMGVIAYGLLRRRVWSRLAVIAHWAVVFAWGVLLGMRSTVTPGLALRVITEAGALGLIAAWYFYRKKNVVAYFRLLAARDTTDTAP